MALIVIEIMNYICTIAYVRVIRITMTDTSRKLDILGKLENLNIISALVAR